MSDSKPQKPFSIAIAGGGIGGLALAIGLQYQHVPFHIYESANAFAAIGAGVAFGPNSLRAMSLIDPAIRKGYDQRATINASKSKRYTWLSFRYGMDSRNGNGKKAGDQFLEVQAETGQNSIHRAHFLEELVKLVPDGAASFGKRVEEIQETADGVKLMFQDGTSAEHTAVIGCDGIKSRIRKIVLGEDNPASSATFTGQYAYRGLVSMETAVSLLGDELARNSQMYTGYTGYVLTYPIAQGDIMNIITIHTKQDGIWNDDEWVKPTTKESMQQDFEPWGQPAKSILSLLTKPDMWALFDSLPASTYHRRGKICLLGDAAHASTPHQGAGAGMALEDAFILSNLLGSIARADGIESVFAAYDAVRRPRTQRVVSTSREAGEIYGFVALGDDVGKIRDDLMHRYDWIWKEDLHAQLRDARMMVEQEMQS